MRHSLWLNSDVDRRPAVKILSASTKALSYNDNGSNYSLSEIAKYKATKIEYQNVKVLNNQTSIVSLETKIKKKIKQGKFKIGMLVKYY